MLLWVKCCSEEEKPDGELAPLKISYNAASNIWEDLIVPVASGASSPEARPKVTVASPHEEFQDASGHTVNMSDSAIETIQRAIISAAGFIDSIAPHSNRSSFVYWAALCGAPGAVLH